MTDEDGDSMNQIIFPNEASIEKACNIHEWHVFVVALKWVGSGPAEREWPQLAEIEPFKYKCRNCPAIMEVK